LLKKILLFTPYADKVLRTDKQGTGGKMASKKVGLVVKADDEAQRSADELARWLRRRDISVVRENIAAFNRSPARHLLSKAPQPLFCVFALGGDGTFLSACRWIGDNKTPVLGVKFGEVGFLAGVTGKDLFPAAEAVLAQRYTVNTKMRLLVRVMRKSKETTRVTVLNDVVINRGALARLAYLKTYVDDQYLTEYRADGLIVSTPTGSTAYALAAGGPVIHPDVDSILLSPICPFTLTNRPLIVPEHVTIKIRPAEGAADIIITFDGQAGLEIDERDTIVVGKSPHPIHIMTLPGYDYFDVLKTKLRWSGGR